MSREESTQRNAASGEPARRRRWAPVVLGALLTLHAACSYAYQVLGQLAADDGAVGVACSVGVRTLSWNVPPDPCRLAGTPWAEVNPVIPLGGTFRCLVSGNTAGSYELHVRCPGYAPLDHPFAVVGCAALFSNCEDIQLGTLVLQRER